MQIALAEARTPGPIVTHDLEQIFNAHSGMIFRTSYRITGNAADAEDVLQTVFLRLLRRPETATDMKQPESYLRRGAINASLDLIRSRHRSPMPLCRIDPPVQPAEIDKDSIRHALASLEPREAEIFALRFLAGHENAEIAAMLGMSKIHVAVTVYRTRQKLQKQLSNKQGGQV